MARSNMSEAALGRERERNLARSAETQLRLREEKHYERKQLQKDINNLTRRTLEWLNEGDRYERLLEETKLRDIGVMMGILTDKTLLLEGQPTQIIGTPQQAQLDQIGQALQVALQQRGLAQTVKLTERTAEIKLEEKP